MKVSITTYTSNPADAIAFAAGVCYGKRDCSRKRIKTCFDFGHLSVFEQVTVQFFVEGISRACSHQLVRHRLNSYCQESQRYCRIKVNSHDWYVVPPSFEDSAPDWYRRKMRNAAKNYNLALSSGARPEDARFLLPEACKTNIVVSTNLRNLFHFFDLRYDEHAQWEIYELAEKMLKECLLNDELKDLVQLYVDKKKINIEF